MHALRKIHAALRRGGVVVDTEPVSAWPRVTTQAGELGSLDMRKWAELIAAVDEQVEATITDGLFACDVKPSFEVADTFATGSALIDTVQKWQGTTIPAALAERLAQHKERTVVHQEVRMRLLRAL